MPPQMVVIMDDPGRAITFKRLFPNTLVIHRTYRPYDNALHRHMSAKQFVNENLIFKGTGVLVQVYNEPGSYTDEFGDVIRFCADVYDEGLRVRNERGELLRFAFVNDAVGHLAETAVPLVDPLLTRIAGYDYGSIWGTHEYATYSMSERPHKIGRFELVANRARQLGLAPIQFGITEYGRDEHGGYDDGYKSHMSSSQYAQFLKEGMTAYSAFNAPVAVFGYGNGFGNWERFDIEHDQVVIDGIIDYGKRNPVQALLRGRSCLPSPTAD